MPEAGDRVSGAAALVVNEVRVNSVGKAARYWAVFASRQRGRITETSVTLGGAVCEVACDDADHARWLMAHLIDQGIPASAMKVTVTR